MFCKHSYGRKNKSTPLTESMVNSVFLLTMLRAINILKCNTLFFYYKKPVYQTRAFLQRNLKNCYPEIKEQCYKTYVRPQHEYASVVWDPVGDGNSHLRHQLEMVQRRAARFVYDDWRRESSPTRMINHLNWQSLETRRLLSRLTFFHKHHHKQIDLNDCIAVKSEGINSTFIPETIGVWNSLPADIRSEADLSNFKLKLINHIE